MSDYSSLIPVNVITGFLGSGKTTLLQRLLASPDMGDAAILINEWGEVGLDHHLLERVDESTVLMQNGCLCCTMRGDLQQSLRNLFSRRERGQVPRFQRVVIETTGLADPVPIAYTLLSEPVLQHHFRLGNIVATIDAVNAAHQLETYAECLKQAAIADRIVLTKTDLADAATVAQLRERLSGLNSAATLLDASLDNIDAEVLLLQDLYDPLRKADEIGRLAARAGDGFHAHARSRARVREEAQPGGTAPSEIRSGHGSPATHPGASDANAHPAGIASFSMIFEDALDWTAFGIWMTMLLNRHGEKVLRIKGILNMRQAATPVVINGVQHIVHPPAHLSAWPDEDRRSRIVFIVRDLSRGQIEDSFRAFHRLSAPDGA